MQPHIMETQVVAQRMNMHFADTLGIVPGLAQLPGQCVGIIPRHKILVPDAAGVLLRHAGIQRSPRGNTGRTGRIGIFIPHALGGQCIEERRFYIRVTGNTKAVAAHLVCHKQDNIRTFIHNKPHINVFCSQRRAAQHGTARLFRLHPH